MIACLDNCFFIIADCLKSVKTIAGAGFFLYFISTIAKNNGSAYQKNRTYLGR